MDKYKKWINEYPGGNDERKMGDATCRLIDDNTYRLILTLRIQGSWGSRYGSDVCGEDSNYSCKIE